VRILRWDGIYVICKVFNPIFIDPRLNGIFFDGDDEVNLDVDSSSILHLSYLITQLFFIRLASLSFVVFFFDLALYYFYA
ncbi:MAG: hypothetical protein ACRENZ_07180, partial [Thermodesulfobacteriota bacterium]